VVQCFFGFIPWFDPDDKQVCGGQDPTFGTISNSTNNGAGAPICANFTVVRDGTNLLQTLSAFILGGFLTSSVNLWLERRKSYEKLCGVTRNLLLTINSTVPNETDRNIMTKWAILGYELSVLKGRGLVDSDSGRHYVKDLNLLDSNE